MIKIIIILITMCWFISIPEASHAQGGTFNINQPGGINVNFNRNPNANPNAEGLVQSIILNVISLFFAVGGIGVIIYFIWGSVDWIMSGGDKEKISNARKKMTNAIIGLILLSLSFAIIRTVGAIAGFDPLGNLQIRGLGRQIPPPGN